MINAYEEFIKHIEKRGVKCCNLEVDIEADYKNKKIRLAVNYSLEQLVEFLQQLDFDYEEITFGDQNIYGTIWYTDGTWSSRGEYDGYECWEYHECPQIPEELGGK